MGGGRGGECEMDRGMGGGKRQIRKGGNGQMEGAEGTERKTGKEEDRERLMED